MSLSVRENRERNRQNQNESRYNENGCFHPNPP
jgi:hypothetical protein